MASDKDLNILLVEDELSHAVLIQRSLKRSGYEGDVVCVDTIAKAKQYLRERIPDLLICDFLLPDGSGENLLPGSPEAAEYPAILMTSHGDEEVAVSALKSGAVDYVVKNDRTIAELPSLISRVLREWDLRAKNKKANQALRESERFLSNIFDAMRDGMCVLDLNRTVLKANRWLEEIAAVDGSLVGRSCSEVFCKGLYCHICPAVQVVETGEARSVELQLFGDTENSRWFEVTAFPFLDAEDNPLGVILHYKDISRHKENEDRNKLLEAQLNQAQKLESIGQLAGGIAHDFNNLLTTIIGNSELALLDLAPGDDGHDEMQEINATAQRAAQLTKQLLAFSRRQAAEPKEINLEEVFAHTKSFLKRLIGEDINLETHIAKPIWKLWIDPVQLDQVLTNLLVNARDAMPDGGSVRLTATNMAIREGSGKAESGIASGEYIRLEVSDTGTGMSEDIKQRIFEPFFTTKDRGKGSGLGLATCYGIVKQNKGAIEVESYPGKGTSFAIFLPRYVGEAEKADTKTDSPLSRSGSETILVVEDEAAIRAMLTRMLEGKGYSVLTAASGEEALLILRSDSGPDIKLIISDVIMPGMDGNEMADIAQQLHPGLRVLFITGYSEDILGDRGIINTKINYIQKPFSRDQLLTTVREIFDMPAQSKS